MTEENKEAVNVDSPARVRHSALVLAAALAMVIILSVQIFSTKKPVNIIGAKTITAPSSRADDLVISGWKVYRDQADRKVAEQQFLEALRLEPDHKAALDGCAQMALLRNDYESAYKLFYKYHELSHKDFRSFANLSITLLMMQRYNEAEFYAEEAVKMHKLENDFQFCLIRASIQKGLGNSSKAEELVETAIRNGGEERVGSMVRRLVWTTNLKELNSYTRLNPDNGDGKREIE